jgi:hypothetical protein
MLAPGICRAATSESGGPPEPTLADRHLARWLAEIRSHALVSHGISAAVMVVGANLLARRVLRHDLGLGGAIALES